MGMRKYNFELLKIFLKKLQAYVEYPVAGRDN